MNIPSERPAKRTATAATLALLAWLLPALIPAFAGSGGPVSRPSRTHAEAVSGHGRVLLAWGNTIAVHIFAGGSDQTVVRRPQGHFVRSPLWMPDGGSFLYLDQTPFLGDPASDYGTDIWQANADGSNQRLVFAHDGKGADIDQLSVSRDGGTLLFGYTRIDLSSTGELVDQFLQVRRLDLATGRLSVVVDQASEPAISPDGKSLLYLDIADADSNQFGLWLRNIDGSNPRPLVTLASGLIAFLAPRYSPDGQTVLFAGVANADATNGPAGCDSLCWAAPSAAHADGPPQDIWTVRLDGSGLARVTTLLEDQPSAAWSADGRQIAVFASSGLYVLNADGSSLSRLGDGQLHGQMDWYDRP